MGTLIPTYIHKYINIDDLSQRPASPRLAPPKIYKSQQTSYSQIHSTENLQVPQDQLVPKSPRKISGRAGWGPGSNLARKYRQEK